MNTKTPHLAVERGGKAARVVVAAWLLLFLTSSFLISLSSPLMAGDREQLALIRAIQQNDLAATREAVEAGADPHAKGPDGKTSAQLAVKLGHLTLAQYLLSQPLAPQRKTVQRSPELEEPTETSRRTEPLYSKKEPKSPSSSAEAALANLDRVLADGGTTTLEPAEPEKGETLAPTSSEETSQSLEDELLPPDLFEAPDLFEDSIPPAAVPDGQPTLADIEAELDGITALDGPANPEDPSVTDEDGYPVETTEQRLARLDRLLAADDTRDPATILAESRARARLRPTAGLTPPPERGVPPNRDAGLPPAEKATIDPDAVPTPDLSIVDRPIPRTPAEAMAENTPRTPGQARRAARARGQSPGLEELSQEASGPPLPVPNPLGNAEAIRDPWFRPGSPGIPTAEENRAGNQPPPDLQPDTPNTQQVRSQQTARLQVPEVAPPPPVTGDRPPSANIPRNTAQELERTPENETTEPVFIPERGTPIGAARQQEPSGTTPATPEASDTPLASDPDLDLLFAEPDPDSSGVIDVTPPSVEPPATAGEAELDTLFAEPADDTPALAPAPASEPDGPGDPALDSLFADTATDPSGDPDLDSLFADTNPADTPSEAIDQSADAQASPPDGEGEFDLDRLFGDLAETPAEPAGPELPEVTPVKLRLDADGLPILPKLWTLPVVIPGTLPPDEDMALAIRRATYGAGSIDPLAPLQDPAAANDAPWPVTMVELEGGNRIQLAAPSVEPVSALTATPTGGPIARDVTLTLGINASLFNIFAPTSDDPRRPPANCVAKARGQTLFCVKGLSWPSGLESNFLVSTILYTGAGAIVRFDKGEPTRLQAVYNADGFDDIADWLVQRFGAPSESVERSVAPFGQPRQDNPTLRWTATDKLTNEISILEIRKYDDTRGGFPDLRVGTIMLYRQGAAGIFPQVSIHELMRLNRTG